MATAPPRPDAVLIRRLRERDRTAWEKLYAEYGPRLHGFAYRLAGNEHDAADLVQETFVRALPRLDKLDPETTQLGPYLFTTLRNLFLKSVERTKRVQPVDEVPEPVRVPAPIEVDPERSTLLGYQQQEVRAANALLSPRQRLVLALRELEDRSYAEIGELVGLNENAVAQLVFRARESLRTELRLAQVDPERLPEPCRSYLPLLAAHLDGQLKGARKEEVLAHLDGCEICQASLESMEEAKRRYRTILLPLGAGEEVARGAEHELELRGYWSQPAGRGGRGSRHARRALLIGVGVLALGAGGLGTAALLDREERVVVAPAPTTIVQTTQPATPTIAPPPPTRAPTVPAVVTVTLGELTGRVPKATTTAPETTEPVTTTSTATTVTVPAPTTPHTSPATKPPAKPKPKVVAPPKPKPTQPKPTQPNPTQPVVTTSQPTTTTTQPGTTAPPTDTSAPTVTITGAPPAATTATSATFSFAASESGVSFACALDGAPFAGCASPAAHANLDIGPHTFAVRATDAAGNTGPAAQHAWTVNQALVLVLPDLVIASLTKNGVVVKNMGNGTAAASILTVTLIGTFSIESLAPGQSTTRSWSTCRAGTLTAHADRTDVVSESNESNNVASLTSTCP